MKKYAIFGNPVIHSKSPIIFNSLFREYSQQNIYKKIRVSNAGEIIEIFNQFDIAGANITSPFKETILQYLDKIDDVATKIHAVNTVIRKGDHLYGFNTDVYGVENAVIKNGLNVKNKKCIVIGAGGAAKAAIYTLKSLNADVFTTNRTDSKSLEISKAFDCKHIEFTELTNNIVDSYLTVIAVKKLDIDITHCLKDTVVLDANYHIEKYSEKKFRRIDGHDWLAYQASKSFEIFFDKIPNHLTMKNILKNETKVSTNIALIGMPGVGKSFYGKIISETMNKIFYDTDLLVEEKLNLKIFEIFQKYGENKFREYEEEVIKDLSEHKNTLVAFGGGAILSENVRKILEKDYFVINLHLDIHELKKSLFKNESEKLQRPLLNNISIEKLFEDRKDYYFSLSDIIIDLKPDAYDENIYAIEQELNHFND